MVCPATRRLPECASLETGGTSMKYDKSNADPEVLDTTLDPLSKAVSLSVFIVREREGV